ncbi:MAG: 16S rRNA processing protein RimM [Anaerolineales bacterium]|nr:16S rRNA processing protein RimM [Anaerolineales bacterium]
MPDLQILGRIARPHGVRGELVLDADRTAADRLAETETVYLGEPPVAHTLTGVRWHRDRLLIQLAGCDDRDAAEAYRGRALAVAHTPAPPLPPGTYYWRDILGLTVITDEAETLGVITEILETGANDVYVVTGAAGEVLIPAAPGVVLSVDLDARQMRVHLLEGLR